MHQVNVWARTACVLSLVLLGSGRAYSQNYQQTNLTSDVAGALHTDPNLINAWGLSRSSTSPWWISDAGSGKSTLYDGTGTPSALVVTIPAAEDGKVGLPSGTIFNGSAAFEVKPGLPARFIFATLDGTISAWNPTADPTNALIKVKRPKASYTGLTNAIVDGKPYLYVPNFASGHIEVYDGAFNRVNLRGDAFRLDCNSNDFYSGHGKWGRFRDGRKRWIVQDLVPFNIQNIGGTLFVAFAQQGDATHHETTGAGIGLVAAFTPKGELIRVFEHGDFLNAPWGVALAPSDFGGFSHALLVGQFGSGEIAAYNIVTGEYIGSFLDPSGNKILIDGLWALSFGAGNTASGPLNTLYFTAGPDAETHGLFGSLTPTAASQTMGNSL